MTRRFVLVACAAAMFLAGGATAAWNPAAGDWGKTDATDFRLMTWNVRDGIRRGVAKNSGTNNWHAIARIIALLKPDVLVLQETADNSCCGLGLDTVSQLETTIDLLFNGGNDPWNGGATVTSYVQAYAPGFDMPYVAVSVLSDFGENSGFNRNVVLSRYPFTDLNGDGTAVYSDLPFITGFGVKYAPGGTGGIRGIQMIEIDLPDATYAGDTVVFNAHLKSGGDTSDEDDRLRASQNAAWIIHEWYNGGDNGVPNSDGYIFPDSPAQWALDANTPVFFGGDLNEEESSNGRKGPADWLSKAEFTGGTSDGTDRDGTDGLYDSATDLTGDPDTLGTRKLDYTLWQDSIATSRRAVVFQSANISSLGYTVPPEFSGLGFPSGLSSVASDHLAVFHDLQLPLADPTGACCDGGACTVETEADCQTGGGTYLGDGTDCTGDPCVPVGACCYACAPAPVAPCPDVSGAVGAACGAVTEAECLASGGVYRGDGTGCGDNPDPCQCPGDINGDGDTNVFDFGDLAASFGLGIPACATRAEGDINCDGVVNVFDFGDLASNFGCQSD